MASLKVGLLSDGSSGNGYGRELLDWAASQPEVDIGHLVIVPPAADPPGAASPRMADLLLRLIVAAESRIFLSSPVFRRNRERIDLRSLVPEQVKIECTGSASPVSDGVESVRRLDLDLLIVLDHLPFPEALLGVPRLGVLSVSNGDDLVIRGAPGGFWEVFHGWETTGFTIRHRTSEIPEGEVLRRGLYPTRPVFALNQASIRAHAVHHLERLLADIAGPRTVPAPTGAGTPSQRTVGPPAAGQILTYLGRLLRRVAPRVISKLRRRTARWGVAFVAKPWREADMRRGVDIPNRPGHFLADPFVVARDGEHFSFVEDYDYSRKRAHIAVHRLEPEGSAELGIAIEEPFHLSFPYPFEFEGQLFICPESAANQDVRIYRCVDFPLGWELVKVVWTDRRAWDTVIFPHDGRWWLLTALDPIGTGNYSSELYAFYADSPLSDSWSPHEHNPVVVDHTRARNGGLIVEKDEIYRVTQRHGFGTYGQSSAIQRIAELTPLAFSEELVATIEPDFREGIEGTHHLHSDGTFTVFDFVRRQRSDV